MTHHTHLSSLALALCCFYACDATETGGSQGPPEAPSTTSSLWDWDTVGVQEVVAEHRPCALDWSLDGQIYSYDRYQWNADDALLVHQRENLAADASENSSEHNSYDADGRRVQEDWDENGDGSADLIKKFLYDADNKVSEVQRLGLGNTIDKREVMTFDASGRVLYWDTLKGQEDQPYLRITHSYDAAGSLDAREFDFDIDGTVDWRFLYDSDASGRMIYDGRDYDADGSVSEERTFAWDEQGKRLSETYLYKGNIAYEINYSYDAAGRLATVIYDHHGNPWFWVATARYTCTP